MPTAKTTTALLWTVVAAALIFRLEQIPTLLALLPDSVRSGQVQLGYRLLWAALHVVCYLLLPLLFARWLGVSARDLGLHLGDSRRQLLIVATVATLGLPAVLLAAPSPSFLRAYPLYRPNHFDWPGEVQWLGIFAAFLFAIEFYFRGFLLALFTPQLGRWALLVALLPYVATHRFWPELIGAAPVGLLLSLLRQRSSSIWPGYLCHLMVALEIEAVALWRHGLISL